MLAVRTPYGCVMKFILLNFFDAIQNKVVYLHRKSLV